MAAAVASTIACAGAPPPSPPPPPAAPTLGDAVLGAPAGEAEAPLAIADAGSADAAALVDATPNGAPVTVLARSLHGPEALAVDRSSVYWVDALEGDLARAPKRGGITMTVYAGTGAPFADGASVAVDDTDLYWTSQVDKTSTLSRQDKNGGKPTVVASSTTALLACVVVDDTHMYWVSGGAIFRGAKSGGPGSSVAPAAKGADCVAVDDQKLYWSSGEGGVIGTAAKTGAGARVLVKGADHAANVHVDDKNVYWQSGDKVMKAPKTGGDAVVLAQSSGPIADIALDDASVYFAFAAGMGRVAKDGGAAETLVQVPASPTSIGVDGKSVYFTTRGTEAGNGRDGTVSRIDKP